jgi:hypothetical protein
LGDKSTMRGFVLLSRRWIVLTRLAWTTCVRRPLRDDEQLPATVAELRLVEPAHLLLQQWMSFSNLCMWFAMVFPLGSEYSRACR